jgi:hypothetical protein
MAENNVHLLKDGLINENNKLFVEGCRKLNYDVQQFPVNIKGCRGSSLCNLGCPNQAKQGTDRVQLPRAEQNGVEVITRCQVLTVGEKTLAARVAAKPAERRAIRRRGRRAITRSTPNHRALRRRREYAGAAAALGPCRTCPGWVMVSPRIPRLSSWANTPGPSPTS